MVVGYFIKHVVGIIDRGIFCFRRLTLRHFEQRKAPFNARCLCAALAARENQHLQSVSSTTTRHARMQMRDEMCEQQQRWPKNFALKVFSASSVYLRTNIFTHTYRPNMYTHTRGRLEQLLSEIGIVSDLLVHMRVFQTTTAMKFYPCKMD